MNRVNQNNKKILPINLAWRRFTFWAQWISQNETTGLIKSWTQTEENRVESELFQLLHSRLSAGLEVCFVMCSGFVGDEGALWKPEQVSLRECFQNERDANSLWLPTVPSLMPVVVENFMHLIWWRESSGNSTAKNWTPHHESLKRFYAGLVTNIYDDDSLLLSYRRLMIVLCLEAEEILQ